MPDFLFDFQKECVDRATRMGRYVLLKDCGLGKTVDELVFAQNVVEHTNKRVLILAPLAVSHQHVSEAEKFGIECYRSNDGNFDYESGKIIVTNYERLHHFNPNDFIGLVCDEASILKSFDGATRLAVTEFSRKLPYRLMATATAAPNDYTELGTLSEAIGELGYMDMLMRFFKNQEGSINAIRSRRFQQGKIIEEGQKWRFKGHAELPFWRWVASWALAMRKPSDLGFDDGKFILPPLIEKDHMVGCNTVAPGYLFTLPAVGLAEQRNERRRTIDERCEKAAGLVTAHEGASLVWCHLNDEGDLLEKLIPGSKQVSGQNSDDEKEEIFQAFSSGKIRKLITKPKIGAWGLNWQHCNHITFFPSHSYEQYYQGVRRCWRFGQKKPVHVDIITTEGELNVMKNLKRKSEAADRMFSSLVAEMNNAIAIDKNIQFKNKEKNPPWL